MNNNNSKFENGMIIHLLSFNLPKNIIDKEEEVRVSITTLPDEKKEHFTIEGKKMYNANHVFTLNVTNQTKTVVMVFRKKTFLQENPIIASTTIHFKDFKEIPCEQITNGIINTEVKTINIYYPLQQQKREEHKDKIERKILGQMQIQLTFTTPYLNQKQQKTNKTNKTNKINKINKINKSNKINKINKIQSHKIQEKKNGYEKLSEENDFCNSYLL